MTISDYSAITLIVGSIATILGWWLRARLGSSIKHEYDRLLELFKTEQKRSDVLHAERQAAFNILSEKLIALRRYCRARIVESGYQSEFAPRTDSLEPQERMSLLMHHDKIAQAFEEKMLFISPQSRQNFDKLFSQMSMGFNLELRLFEGASEKEYNASGLYELVSARVDDVLNALYADLGFPERL